MNLLDSLFAVLFEPFTYEFMQRALSTALLTSVVCALLSCWLVLIGWSLLGDAVSHAVLPGVVLSYAIGIPFAIGAIVFGLLAVTLIGTIKNTSRVKEDSAIGIVFSTLFALGLVLVSLLPSNTDLSHILFGNLLGVSHTEVLQIAVLSVVVTAVLLLKRKDMVLFAFDQTHALSIGLRPRLLGALLLGLLALTSVAALQAVGVILVVAMLIIPGATAYLLTNSFQRMLLLASSIAAACALIGVYSSYYFNTPSGPTIVLAQGVAFTLAYLCAPKRGIIVRAVQRAQRKHTLKAETARLTSV